MEPGQVRSAADARTIVEKRGVPHVKLGAFDIDGIMRGKYIPVWELARYFEII